MRLIDADALKAKLPEPTTITQYCVYRTLCDFIDNAPTVESHVEVEITEHHTFAKPDDVSDLDFPGVSSEDK